MIAEDVIGDFRAPDVIRFGLAPLYLGYEDLWIAVERLRAILDTGRWRDARFAVRGKVTLGIRAIRVRAPARTVDRVESRHPVGTSVIAVTGRAGTLGLASRICKAERLQSHAVHELHRRNRA